MLKNISKQVWVIISVVALALVVWFVSVGDFGQKTDDQAIQVEVGEIEFRNDGLSVYYAGVMGETALATLKSLTEVETQDSSFGEFVTGINGVNAEDNINFWAFYVNSGFADEGAGTYEAKEGDQFAWHLEDIELY